MTDIFITGLDVLLLIVLGVTFVRQRKIFRTLKQIDAMNRETERIMTASTAEREQWLKDNFGVRKKSEEDNNGHRP